MSDTDRIGFRRVATHSTAGELLMTCYVTRYPICRPIWWTNRMIIATTLKTLFELLREELVRPLIDGVIKLRAIINEVNGHLKARNVLPMSLGIKVRDQGSGNMSVIVPRISKVPNETDYINW